MGAPPKSFVAPAGRAIAAVAPVLAAAAIGNAATIPNLVPWYAGLVKPSFTPPNGIFGPVWTLLYVAMAVAFWRILGTAAGTAGRRGAIFAFLVQAAFNAAWSVAFFGFHAPLAGLVVIVALLAAIVATIRAFAQLDAPAAWLLAPTLAWVGFAGVLNGAVWLLNR